MRSKIEQQVMGSVAVIYTVRKFTSRRALECYALLLCILAVASLISVPHVLNNFTHVAPTGPVGIGNFVLVALKNTTFAVQLLALLGTITLVLLLADTLRTTRLIPRTL